MRHRFLSAATAFAMLHQPVFAETGPARGMIFCYLGSGNIPPPKDANLAILLSGRFDEVVDKKPAPQPIMATADPDEMLGGMAFSWIRMQPEGHYSVQTEDSGGKRWDLVLLPARDGFYQAGLSEMRSGTAMTFRGYCGFLQMGDGEAEFLAHPPRSSAPG